jgi:hypothetical protein
MYRKVILPDTAARVGNSFTPQVKCALQPLTHSAYRLPELQPIQAPAVLITPKYIYDE